MFQRFFLIFFICYLPIYIALLFLLKTKIAGYSAKQNVVSLLATSKKPWGTIFNISTVLYGLSSFILPICLLLALGINTLSVFGAILLLVTGIATILVGFFPMNISKYHELVSYLVFSSVIFTGIVFIPIYNLGNTFPPYMRLVNYGVIGITILLALSSYINKKTVSLLEWSSLIGTIGWNFLLAISLLSNV